MPFALYIWNGAEEVTRNAPQVQGVHGLARHPDTTPVEAEQCATIDQCGSATRPHTFDKYLRWLHRSTRTHIKPSYTENAVEDDSEEDVIEDMHDMDTRGETQP
jgi:hypothetical protein